MWYNYIFPPLCLSVNTVSRVFTEYIISVYENDFNDMK